MKVILNTITNYQDAVLKQGDTIDVELRVADRWIKLGLAHLPEVKPVIPFGDFVPSEKEQKIIEDYSEKAGWPIKETKADVPEEVVFREPEIIESDLEFEKLPEVTEENKDEIKTYIPKKKSKKIKKANEDNT